MTFINCRKLHDFVACTVEGISYVATSKDNVIMRRMFVNRYNFAVSEMKRFHELAKQYYNVDDSSGYFLDLGANIGTTNIYFTKKLAPNLKILAFEPDAENFKLLRTNLILNDIGLDKATVVNCGLGDKFDEMTMYRNLTNPGANRLLFKVQNDQLIETVKIVPLDAYLIENKIAASEVKYIWIDTEGFEPQVLLGAKNLLRENPAPIFMEFNLNMWKSSGGFEPMMSLLMEYYSHFIYVKGNIENLYPLEMLLTIDDTFMQKGDIFLIKKGAIA